MARTRKQQTLRPAEEQKVSGVSNSLDSSGPDPNSATEGNGSAGRKTANTGRAARRTPVRRMPQAPVVAPPPEPTPPPSDLEKFTRDVQLLLEDLRRIQHEASEARQQQRASLAEMKELIGELRGLKEQERAAPPRETQAEATAAPPAPEVQPAAAPERGWLGVTVEPAVVVVEVEDGSPAQTANLAPGDVITGINGIRVHDASELRAQVEQTQASEKVAVKRVRGGQTETVETHFEGPAAETLEGPGRLGVTVEPVVLVAEVLAETPAEAAGLALGDVITGVNGVRVLNAVELQKRIDEAAGEEITVELARGERVRVVRVRLEAPAPPEA